MAANKSREIIPALFGFTASAILLTLIQAPLELPFLAWFALVPFILVCSPQSNLRTIIWSSYLVGVLYWLSNLYWIAYVTIPAYILLCLYLGLYWPVLAMAVRYCRRFKYLPLFIAVPVLFVGAEALQGSLFTGFGWRFLAHSQYANIRLIQIADIFGAAGVSFIVAMVNGQAAEIVYEAAAARSVLRAGAFFKTLFVAAVLSAVLFYGTFRINQSKGCTSAGPIVGVVQPNVPSEIKESEESGLEIVTGLVLETQKCFDAGAFLVAWPETMVPASLNGQFLSLSDPNSNQRLYDRMISHSCRNNGFILVGAHTSQVGFDGYDSFITDRFNSAFLYRPDGKQYPKRYDKIHLVPFGEYIPFKKSWPFFYNIVLKLGPYDYEYNLTVGREYTAFEAADGSESYSFGVLICYEDTDPKVTSLMVNSRNDKKADWLMNLSNDGWYVRYKDGKVIPSVELAQRTAISVFRAVENRVSIVRSVNTGISCLIDPLGRIQDGCLKGTVPEKAIDRQGVAGWFIDRVPIDSRKTFFSIHGLLLDFCCGGAFVVVSIASIVWKSKKQKSGGMKK